MKRRVVLWMGLFVASVMDVNLGQASMHAMPMLPAEARMASIAADAAVIVSGVVREAVGRYGTHPNYPQGQIILTDFTIELTHVFKGNVLGRTVTVEVPGGCVDGEDLCFHSTAVPTLVNGEDVLLFLERVSDQGFRLVNAFDAKQARRAGMYLPAELSVDQLSALVSGGVK